MNSAIGMMLGLFASMALIVVHERADRTVQKPGDLALWVNLIELGVIPGANKDHKMPLYSVANGASSPTPRMLSSDLDDKVELVTFQHKPSMVAEAFRSVLTSVLFQNENGRPPQVLVFTSAQPAEGKTTIVSNLAISVAEIRRKTLIIDADMRRSRMHKIFGMDNENGLSDLLLEEINQDTLAACIKPSTIPNLDVITAGSATSSATNLLHSPNMVELLEICRKQYDMILIDTPPALQITDARVLGRLSDAVIFVARANSTTRDALSALNKRFSDDRIRVIGAILNIGIPRNPVVATMATVAATATNTPATTAIPTTRGPSSIRRITES